MERKLVVLGRKVPANLRDCLIQTSKDEEFAMGEALDRDPNVSNEVLESIVASLGVMAGNGITEQLEPDELKSWFGTLFAMFLRAGSEMIIADARNRPSQKPRKNEGDGSKEGKEKDPAQGKKPVFWVN